nr:uncharacterized protein CTRU02_05841 [Colletotrichum truncatum]KAF6793586.1 hypothetical protein CTRU02_05841 [Colletotrichum truncatum]
MVVVVLLLVLDAGLARLEADDMAKIGDKQDVEKQAGFQQLTLDNDRLLLESPELHPTSRVKNGQGFDEGLHPRFTETQKQIPRADLRGMEVLYQPPDFGVVPRSAQALAELSQRQHNM